MKIDRFIEELKKLNIFLSEEQLLQLEQYYNLLIEWNKKITLTGITEHDSVYLKHFYDSITLSRIIDLHDDISLCDIGTGAGFPGIVLKIVFPNLKVTLIDSLNKRINFLNTVIDTLKLKNIVTICSRAEEYSINNRELFDVVTARAVAPLSTLLEYSIPLVKVNGYFIAMKSDVKSELININNCEKVLDVCLDKIDEFKLPIEDSLRTLVKFKKNKITSNKFPRKYSLMKKNPL